MKCELCDAKATVYYSQLIDGQMKKICLCESCAENKGIMDPSAFSMVDIILNKEPQQAVVAPVAMTLGSCDQCGFTLADFKKVGRLGCSHCYTVFRGEVESMLEKMHRGTKHVGKVPEGMMDALEKKQRLETLKQKLEQAIADEHYEEAAKLRDEIQEIEEEKQVSKKEGK